MRWLLLFLILSQQAFSQEKITNRSYFKKFLNADDSKRLLIIGENHASAVSSLIYPNTVKYLNRKTGLRTLLVEFGPAEAFFYNKYLETGNEKHLNYTLYAGAIKGWREAWRELYKYNQKLKQPLHVQGVDFDRTRTMAYALYSIFMAYDDKPDFVKELMTEIRDDSFYKTYTIGYPTAKDLQWNKKTKELLKRKLTELNSFLSEEDGKVIGEILDNKAVSYSKEREKALAANTQRIINNSAETDFLLLIGRSHAYLNPVYCSNVSLARMLSDSTDIQIRTGSLLYENTDMYVKKGDPITLFEIKKKTPWKRYYDSFQRMAVKDITLIPFTSDLWPLMHYSDFAIIVKNQKAYELLSKASK